MVSKHGSIKWERIAIRLGDLGINQDKLVELTGIDQPQLSRYMNGTTAPSIATIIKLSKWLECSSDYLLGIVDDPKPPEPLSGLDDDDIAVLRRWQDAKITLINKIVDEGVAELDNALRDAVKAVIANTLLAQGKFDSRRNNP